MTNRFEFRCWVVGKGANFSFKCYIKPYAIRNEWGAIFNIRTVARSIIHIIGKKNTRKYCRFLLRLDDYSKELVGLPCVVEQCTGAKDKNGKLIYEGDILEGFDFRCVVKWNERLGGFYGYDSDKTYCTLNDYYRNNSVVIGNVNENPELLGVKNERQ